MKKVYTERSRSGYTLVELLIVLTLISILSVIIFINLHSFQDDNNTKIAADSVRNLLDLAKSNASSGLTCSGSSADWSVTFDSQNNSVTLQCPNVIKTLDLSKNNTQIQSINDDCTAVTFTKVSGQTKFENCSGTVASMTITLQNTNNSDVKKTIIIDKGGNIEVK